MATILPEQALTFDDLLLVPQRSDVHPRDADLSVRLTDRITLTIPILSAAMDTVTEHRLAIALAQAGGLGVIHKNMTTEGQAREVEKVKRSEAGVITDPKTLDVSATINEAQEMMELHHISGMPILDGNKVVGIVTRRDLKYQRAPGTPITEVMTTELITAKPKTALSKARDIMYQAKVEKLILVDGKQNLKGLITLKDLERESQFPHACHDERGRLRVGAAVGVHDYERVSELVAAGVDILVVDSAHGHSSNVMDTVKGIKKHHDIDVIAGNIATAQGARDLIKSGADVVKVGIGPGSICTTRVVAGTGMPQVSAVMGVAAEAHKKGARVVADGGIKFSGDLAKALAAGGDVAMLGSMLAGADESPGEQIIYQGRAFKTYRGMGSIAAMQKGSADRYFQDSGQANKLVAEGIEGMVPVKGPVGDVIYQMMGGLRSAMGYSGAATLGDFQKKATFVQISGAGLQESHPHTVRITKEAPNYRADS